MTIIKCKMCGGDIELTADKTFGTCEFCGSTMTLPKINDEQRAAAFNRGNHFRRIGEFDKALAVYERIVREDNTDAEAHWCCALCRFGIEYVEDPTTYEYLPTCHRASFDSFLEDVDYKAAMEYSDGITRRQYQKDAAKIAEVQRGILATSQNTEPYDVFICYKESDENGGRTRDSLIAQDIYYQLTEQGRKVFFARITLEDVAGTQYEPYIFAALNSAKVMIVVGTKPEYLNAVWVRNEWSRFLSMMKKDRHKLLLPCYRNMDPYDLPEALSVLQSYDMSKIGFIQDLTRGISKVLDAEKKPEPVKETVVVQQSAAPANNIAPLLKRALMFLEDGDWNSADEYCEKVLDMDPECAEAYLGKLMAELHVYKQEDLRNCQQPFDDRNSYQKAVRFADSNLRDMLKGYITQIKDRNEQDRLEAIYGRAKSLMNRIQEEIALRGAARLFESIRHYKDAAVLMEECRQLAELARKNAIYNDAVKQMSGDQIECWEEAIKGFEQIPSWKDAEAQIAVCRSRIAEILERDQQAETARKDKIYIAAVKRMTGNRIEDYQEAIESFDKIPGWKDTEEQIAVCRSKLAELLAKRERDRIAADTRNKKKKRLFGIAAAVVCVIAVLLAALAGKNMSDAATQKEAAKCKVTVFWYSENDTFLSTVRTALNAELDALGIEYDNRYADNDITKQMAQVEEAVAEGSDLLVVNLVDSGNTDFAEAIVNAAGDIPVIFYNRPIGNNGSDISLLNNHSNACFIGTDETGAGRMQGNIIGEYVLAHYDTIDLNGDGVISYAMMMGSMDNREAFARTQFSVENANEILAAAGKPALSYFDASNLACYQPDPDGAWSSMAAFLYMETNLVCYNKDNGNMIELVICNNDDMALGVIDALQQAGFNLGHTDSITIPVFGIDATNEVKALVADGVMAGTVGQNVEGLVDAIAQTISAVSSGKAPAEALASLADERFTTDPQCASKLYVAFLPYTGE